MADVTVSVRVPAPAALEGPADIDRLLRVEAAARGGAEAALSWEAPQPWTGAGQERLVGRAPGLEVVWIRSVSDGSVSMRIRRSEPPAFELTWRRGAELLITATLPEPRAHALRAALRALSVVVPPPAPPRARSRAELLAAVADAATAVGSELDALDRGQGSWERIAALDREARAALEELPGDDAGALRSGVASGLAHTHADVARGARERALEKPDPVLLRQRATALRIDALGGGAGAPRAFAAAAARLRDALEVDPPSRAPARAEEWIRVAHLEASAGHLGGARLAFEQAVAASATVARRSLVAPQLEPWRAELAAIAYAGKLPKAVAPYGQDLAGTWRPTIRLVASATPTGDGPTSRLGGLPSLPPAIAWPLGPDGAAMSFLLQLDLATLPTQPPLPRRGLLLVFVAGGPGHGHGLMEAGVRVLHIEDPPPVAAPAPGSARPLLPRPCVLWGPAAVEPVSPPDAALGSLCPALAADARAVRALGRAFPSAGTKLGGYAFFTQEDPRGRDAVRADHVQLLQVDEVPNAQLAWGDGGVGHVFVPPDDLARLDFSRAWWWWDSL